MCQTHGQSQPSQNPSHAAPRHQSAQGIPCEHMAGIQVETEQKQTDQHEPACRPQPRRCPANPQRQPREQQAQRMKLLLTQSGLHGRGHAPGKHRQMREGGAERHAGAGADCPQDHKPPGRQGPDFGQGIRGMSKRRAGHGVLGTRPKMGPAHWSTFVNPMNPE
jgi:hypothetical protein